MTRARDTSAFTLVEMLLVVAIIVILLGMLLPQFKKPTDNVCANNLRIIYQATVIYAAANARYFPPARQGDTNDPGWVQTPWHDINAVRNGVLYSYMGGNEKAYVCPVFESVFKFRNPGHANKTPAFTYSLSEYTGRSWQGKAGIRTFSGEVKTAEFGLYSDENAWIVTGQSAHEINNGAMGVGAYGNVASIVDAIGSFHQPIDDNLDNGYANVVFVDGHVNLHHITESKEVMTPTRYKN